MPNFASHHDALVAAHAAILRNCRMGKIRDYAILSFDEHGAVSDPNTSRGPVTLAITEPTEASSDFTFQVTLGADTLLATKSLPEASVAFSIGAHVKNSVLLDQARTRLGLPALASLSDVAQTVSLHHGEHVGDFLDTLLAAAN